MLPFSKHPWVLLGAGLLLGYFAYRHRAAIRDRLRTVAEQTDSVMSGPRARLDAL